MREVTAELLVDCACETGEGPVWDEPSQALWWTDIPRRRLYHLDPGGGVETMEMPGRVGCFAFRESGGLVLAMEHGFYRHDPGTCATEIIAEPETELTKHRFNDGRCDRAGRFLAGSMNLARDAASARLWQLDPAGSTRPVVEGLTVSNGLAFDADGSRMYLVDGGRRQIYRYAYGDDGMPRDQTLFQDDGSAPGRPDGGAVDVDGCYWSARWAGSSVVRFTPDGRVDTIVRLPVSRVTMCAFGGADLDTLFITTAREGMTPEALAAEPLAGAVFVAQPGSAGLTEPRFAG